MGKTTLRFLPYTMLASVLMTTALSACREEDPVGTVANQGAFPTMVTTAVDTYVSDSGYIKYHAVTDVWEVYDDTVEPFWRFPYPLIIDILDPGMKPNAHIECDSANYKTRIRLFRFDGDVVAVNVNRDTFLTEQLFWDQNRTEFYTDSFIHIVKSGRVLEGYGFRSNEKMTDYRILRPTAILPENAFRNQENRPVDSTDTQNAPYIDPLSRPTPVRASERNRRQDFDEEVF